jgi:hypothetical protein
MTATLWRGLGLLIGGAAGILAGIGLREAFGAGAGIGFGAIGGLVAVTVVLYLVARTQTAPGTAGGEIMPGLLLGLNTGINAVVIEALVGPAPAAIVCAIPLLAVIAPLARTDIYQAPLGWVNLLLPMSWPIVGLGIVFVLVSALLALPNLAFKTEFLKIEKLMLDAKTGTTFLVGGLAGNANLSPDSTGYNMGSFSFLRTGHGNDPSLVEHEAGHTLNLAIWGAIVHLIGALDENVFGGHNRAYTELFAEGNVPGTTSPSFPMWSEAGLAAAPTGT